AMPGGAGEAGGRMPGAAGTPGRVRATGMAIDPTQPTSAPAGSKAKQRVLRERARRELPLFLQGDCTAVTWGERGDQTNIDRGLRRAGKRGQEKEGDGHRRYVRGRGAAAQG